MLFWLRCLALVALVTLVVGCGDEETQELPNWTFQVGDDLTTSPITLPVHVDGRLPRQPTTYRLRSTARLRPELRGKDLVLTIAQLGAKTSLSVGGRPALALEEEPTDGYRSAGPHAWRIPRAVADSEPLALELTIEHRWTQSGWLDTVPRLSATERGDEKFRRIRAVSEVGGLAALGTLLPFGFTHFFLFLLDRRRTQNGWFALQAVTASMYPFFVLGFSQYVFGIADTVILGITQAIAPVAGLCFTRAAFKLGPAPRFYGVLLAIVCVIPIFAPSPFRTNYFLAPAVVVIGYVAIGQHLLTLARLIRDRPRPNNARVLLPGWLFILATLTWDGTAWAGLAEPFDGLRIGTWGLAVIGLLQSVALSRDHIFSLRQADTLNLALAERVAFVEAQKEEIQTLNDELRRQIAERSRQVSMVVTRIASGAGDPADLAPDDVVEHRYRVVRAIGAGGMGSVYEVVRLSDGRRLALKVLTGISDGIALARFAREAQIAAGVDHSNVVAILDMDVATSGYLYLVMELVDGPSLAQRKERYGDVAWALPILRQIADGLAAIHAKGIVHRDLKPANVLLTESASIADCTVKISDFGVSSLAQPHAPRQGDVSTLQFREPREDVALATKDDRGATSLTLTGVIMGTPVYMAPEQARAAKAAAASADVFSLGVIAFEILVGTRPFAEPLAVAALAGRGLPDPPPPIGTRVPSLGAELGALLDRMLRVVPEERPTARAVADALAAKGARRA